MPPAGSNCICRTVWLLVRCATDAGAHDAPNAPDAPDALDGRAHCRAHCVWHQRQHSKLGLGMRLRPPKHHAL